jgi:hypothetical protein
MEHILANPGLLPAVQRTPVYPFFEAGVEDKLAKGYMYDFTASDFTGAG